MGNLLYVKGNLIYVYCLMYITDTLGGEYANESDSTDEDPKA